MLDLALDRVKQHARGEAWGEQKPVPSDPAAFEIAQHAIVGIIRL